MDDPRFEVVPEGVPLNRVEPRSGEITRSWNVGWDRFVVLETRAFGGTPHLGIKDPPSRLGDFNSLGSCGSTFSSSLDNDVHRLELGNPKVVARERGWDGVGTRFAGSPKGACGNVATHRSPNLPVVVQRRPKMSVPEVLHRRVIAEISHASMLADDRRPLRSKY